MLMTACESWFPFLKNWTIKYKNTLCTFIKTLKAPTYCFTFFSIVTFEGQLELLDYIYSR